MREHYVGTLISGYSMSFESMQQKAAFLYAVNAILLGAIMAFFMEIAEYLVVTYTSSLTLSVAGIFKVYCAGVKILLCKSLYCSLFRTKITLFKQ